MRRFLFLLFVVMLAIASCVAANSLSRSTPPLLRGAPITKMVIQLEAPISILSITKATSRVFKVEIVNLSDKSIQGLNYLYAKKCSTHTEPGGGGILFTPEKMLGPGKRMVFDAGDEDPVKEIEIQNCLDNATE